MARIPVATSPGAKASPRPTGLSSRESLMNHQKERMQMAGSFGAPGALSALDGYGGCMRVSRRSRRNIASAGSCESGLSGGLSRMRGNPQVRFLGELGARKGPRLTRRPAAPSIGGRGEPSLPGAGAPPCPGSNFAYRCSFQTCALNDGRMSVVTTCHGPLEQGIRAPFHPPSLAFPP